MSTAYCEPVAGIRLCRSTQLKSTDEKMMEKEVEKIKRRLDGRQETKGGNDGTDLLTAQQLKSQKW